jgi:hypothetical protein
MTLQTLKGISDQEMKLLNDDQVKWLYGVFDKHNGYPTLEQLWASMDALWRDLGCDSSVMDSRIGAYYAHPVWLLNGLFIEQHQESLNNRAQFKNWVVKQAPHRVAEFGGGFGGLARMIGAALPSASIEIIEPHPTPIGISPADNTANVRYRPEMDGEYDVLISTDVFEHVSDPLQLLY